MLSLQVPEAHQVTQAPLEHEDLPVTEVFRDEMGYQVPLGEQDQRILFSMDQKDHLDIRDGMASTDTEVIIIFITAPPLFRSLAAAAIVIAVLEQRSDQQQIKPIFLAKF